MKLGFLWCTMQNAKLTLTAGHTLVVIKMWISCWPGQELNPIQRVIHLDHSDATVYHILVLTQNQCDNRQFYIVGSKERFSTVKWSLASSPKELSFVSLITLQSGWEGISGVN